MAVAVSILALMAAGACGGDDDGDSSAGAPQASSSSTPTSEEADGTPVLELADSPLGEILVDAEGRTLYLFTKDEGGTSTCTGGCADQWPPVEAPADPTVGDGLDEELVGTTTRDDGSSQLTYNGAPLYRFTPDASPGDVNGHGVGGVWFVVGADGKALTEAAAADAPEPSY